MNEIAPRVIILGDSGVGKTVLIHRMKTGEFLEQTTPTIGAGVTAVEVDVEGIRYPLQIWDTAGQELYRSIIPIYFKGAVFAMLCFSLTDQSSFTHLDSWLDEIAVHSDQDIGIVLVGTKYDSIERLIGEDAVKRYAEMHKLTYFLTSSVTGQNVNTLLEYVAVAQADKKKTENRPNQQNDLKPNSQKKGCC
jgi:small GTP-binding protein